ncbi:MAG: cell wall-binding repeat-containing protein [Lachnospiraceae bacterium]|nr:cell wall-binding repeat-containing protein [Lachnospiraceae bacterium]
MKLRKNALIAMGLAFSMVVQTPMAAFATETQTTEVVAEAAENTAENAVTTAEETVQVDETQLSPWLITEVVADTVTGERYSYAEIYNNSDAELDLADYVLYYDYRVAGQEGGYVFSKNAEVSYTYPGQTKAYTKSGFYSASSTDQVTSIPVKSGEALVLWYNNNLTTTSLEEFKTFYGLGDDVNIIRINHSGLHQSKKRGFRIGKDDETILVEAISNASGDQITDGTNTDKQAYQYAYPASGRKCTLTGIAAATPGQVMENQVPSTRVIVAETQISIGNVTATGDGDFVVTAEIPYEGTAGAMVVNLTYNQSAGTGEDAITSEDITIAMTPVGDGKTFTATVPKSEVWGTSATYSIKASYGGTNKQTTEQVTIELNRKAASTENGAPLIITELASTSLDNNYDFFELYNQSDKTINLGVWTIYICYDYPNQTSAQSGNNMKFVDFTATIAPGETKVCWVNQKDLTVDDFNTYYGTNLTEENIVEVDYNGMHASSPRWFKIGYTEADAFTVAGFNEEAWQIPEATYALQYAVPNDDTGVNKSIPVKVDVATPGNLASWQVTDTVVPFNGYPGYQEDDGQAPTLAVCDVMEKPVPESITEGENLQVIYDVDLLLGSGGGDARVDAFSGEYHGGSEALKNRPRLIGTEIYYKLDNETEWTVVKEKKQHSLGHYLMQLTSDVLYGHDQVTFKVRAYTLYGYSETEENVVKINRLNDTNGEVRLNVSDGALVSGDITITANDGNNNADTQIMVDGAAQPLKRTFENGAYFFIKASDMNTYFKNAVTAPYGENEREILAFLVAWRQLPQSRAIRVDNKYFTYNAETDTYDTTVTVWAGDQGTPFEEIYDIVADANHEDFTVSGLQMKLVNGNSYLPTLITPENEKTNNSTALDAVHKVGDSTGMSPFMGVSFSIPAADAEAVGTTVNTKDLSEGTHTIVATAGDKTTEAVIIVDNKNPEINLGIEEGATVYDTIYVDILNVTDENGINDVMISLDDTLVEYPATIIPRDLSVGEHTLTVAATDMAGNAETKTITFITEEVDPTIGETGNGVVEYETAELSVSLDSTADVAFYEGRTLTVENAGITAGEVVEPGNGEAPYQVLSLNTGDVEAGTELALSWNGAASNEDATHPLTMFAMNVNTNTWAKIGQADAEGNINVEFLAGDYVADGKVVLLVQCLTKGTQPKVLPVEAEELVEENEALEVVEMTDWDGTARPEDYDFAFAWETDTQYYAESFPYHYTNMNQWIVDNADEWKIRYVFHTGDIVDDCDMLGEWKVADGAMKIFDDAGMPYGVLGGNHDVYAGAEGYGSYWQYFGEERFADKDYYGGSYDNNKGHYDLLTENGEDFVIIYMSWDIYEEELNWMNEVLQKYSDRKAILAFHRYINAKGEIDYTGKLIQEQVVAKNPNVFMVIDGHYHGASYNITSFDDNGDGVDDRTVYQVCTDYQTDPEGGSEYIKFMYFDLENNKVYLNSYSPYRQDFNYYDKAKQSEYVAGNIVAEIDIAEFDVDFGGAESYNKTLATNSVTADVRTTNVIGTVENASETANYTWEGLTPGTIYSWYARVTNDRNGVTTTPVQSFTTMTVVEAEKYEITATAGEGGTISAPGISEIEEGASITYTITAEEGYKVAKVLVDGYEEELVDGTYTFENVTDNHTIEVTFEKIETEPEVPMVQGITRIAGEDRNDTSYKVADALKEELGIEKFDTVIVATGKKFADALSGSYLAVVKDAPILLTNGKEENVKKLCEYIDVNLNADGMIYVLGGEEAVSSEVEAILDTDYDVKRLSGSSRYETSIEILKEAGLEEGTDLIVATGKDFADSLSASAVKKPILLVKPNAALTDAQKELVAKAGQIYIVGGTGAVTEETEAELSTIGNVTRIAGAGRQETSKLVAEEFFGEVETVVVAKAMDFPDGLCGGPLAAAMDAPLLLTRDGKSDIAEGYVMDNGIESGIVLGGTNALADQTVVDVFALESAEDILVK